MKTFECKDIREVWDFRLSIGNPILYCNGETWIVRIWANNPGDEKKKLFEEHDTGVPTDGNPFQPEGVKACYEWLYSVRDKYSRDHIELRKPVVKLINESNQQAAAINAEMVQALKDGDQELAATKKGTLVTHLDIANTRIKKATDNFHKAVAEIEGVA